MNFIERLKEEAREQYTSVIRGGWDSVMREIVEEIVETTAKAVAHSFQVVLNDGWELERTRTEELSEDRKIIDAEKIYDNIHKIINQCKPRKWS